MMKLIPTTLIDLDIKPRQPVTLQCPKCLHVVYSDELKQQWGVDLYACPNCDTVCKYVHR